MDRWVPKVKNRLPVVQVPATVMDAHRSGTHELPTSGTHELPSSGTIKIEENQTEEQQLEADYLAARNRADNYFNYEELDDTGPGKAKEEYWEEYNKMDKIANTLKRQLDNINTNNRSTGGTRRHKKRGKKANSYRRTTRRHKKRGKKANSHRRKHYN
jgi:uncharacterized protein YukE